MILNSPAISVIMPAYNQAQYVSEAIQSVLDQTYPDFELIVVDDGSTDETQRILAGIQDPRLCIIRQPNAGLSAARNTGLRKSSAPFVTFLDADDYFLPDKLEILSGYLEVQNDIGLVAGRARYVDQLGKTILDTEEVLPRLALPELLLENPICVSAVLLRRSCLEHVGEFDETMRACEDWDLWLRLLAEGYKMAWVDKPVVAYRIHPGQMTRQSDRMRIAIFMTLDKFFGQLNLPEKLFSYKSAAYSVGWVHSAAYAYLSDEGEKETANLAEALRVDPTLRENHYQRLVRILVSWANDPRSTEPTLFLERIIENPPSEEAGLVIQLRQQVADAILAPLFDCPRDAWRDHRQDLLKVVRYKPDWLLNRGVLRMLAYAWVGF
jgi:glycosyltransferase involved in cell wall biosynthesis